MATSSTPHLTLSTSSAPAGGEEIRISAIDIGSNSIRQTIADVSPNGTIRVVDEMKAAPRLGAGLLESGVLSEIAIQNALIALSRMATLGSQLGVKRTEVVATSAVRDAENGKEFLARVQAETALRVRILRGEDEARLSFRSALAHFDLGSGRAVVMDIGGGSLELALSEDGLVERLVSLPLGAIHMSERYLSPDARKKGLRKLRKQVRNEMRRRLTRHWRVPRIFCSGGTFTSLASMYLARVGMAQAKTVHGTVIPRVELEHIVDMLQSMSLAERQTVPGLNAARSDIIVGGLAVAAEVAARVEAKELVVSAYGIREGILLESAHVAPTPADPGEARERSVLQLAERTHYEAPHSQHVQKLALQLFDSIGQRLGCAPEDRRLLADAALLHDIGYHISYDKHNKHSYHLIEHAELLGMTPSEQITVANVARYHRGAEPKKTHSNYSGLDKQMRRTIKRLSAILRVADGFDRGHASAVAEIKARWLERALRLTAVPRRANLNLRLDLWGAARKSNLLAEVAGVPVEIVGPDGSVMTYDDEVGAAD
ncbi:MAG: Ppx/GppA family phosphatase [Gemmatimonadetes bacterium]|nr:MAG: Ppx/GppA family phosphatase [Gemmatimonadota bacterium]PYO78776.1 MAG: Ppx/GppA family phosphatase [Gemmatimonadota bacterium]